MARANIRIGPITQFWTSDWPRISVLGTAARRFSYRTLASGGYIMTISPAAIGTLVVPTLRRLITPSIPG
jgi:hypothetical protein